MSDKEKAPVSNWSDLLKQAESLQQKLSLVALDMSLLRDPEDAIIDFNLPDGLLSRYEKNHFRKIVQKAAALTGDDPEQIADKDRRTPAQQEALMRAAAAEQVERIDAFLGSNYLQALKSLRGIAGKYDPPEGTPLPEMTVKEAITGVFFAIHDEIRPRDPAQLTQGELNELKQLLADFERLLDREFNGDPEKALKNNAFMGLLERFISENNPDEAIEIGERLKTGFIIPTKYLVPANKLMQVMTRDIMDVGKIMLEESRKGAKRLVETSVILSYEGENVKISGRRPFTEYDKAVYNSVSSLYVSGNSFITPAQIYRTMNGLTDGEKAPPQQVTKIKNSLDKMRFIRAQIDCTAELQARRVTLNSEQIKSGIIDTYLLTADAIEINGIKGYRIQKTPILYEYSAAVKQVIQFPVKLLDVKILDRNGKPTTCSFENSDARTVLKTELLTRIEGMKNEKNSLKNRVIRLTDYERDGEIKQGLYSKACNPEAKDPKDEKKRVRGSAEKMLDYWKAVGYIKDYKPRKEARTITGYEIIL